ILIPAAAEDPVAALGGALWVAETERDCVGARVGGAAAVKIDLLRCEAEADEMRVRVRARRILREDVAAAQYEIGGRQRLRGDGSGGDGSDERDESERAHGGRLAQGAHARGCVFCTVGQRSSPCVCSLCTHESTHNYM